MSTPEEVVIDLQTGKSHRRPLAGPDLDDYNARLAALPAQVAAGQTVQTNAITIRQRARAAIAANLTYLALPAPATQAQAVTQMLAQVAALTRQVDALIRLALGAFDDTT
jgi:uncharacterized heparinase superfamily protein